MASSSQEPPKLTRRERRMLKFIGNALDQAVNAYDQAKAQDQNIEEALLAIRDATDTRLFALALNLAAAVEELHPMGPFRLEWVMAGRKTLVRLTGEFYSEAEEEAELRVQKAESYFSERLGQTLIVWMAAIGSTRVDDVTSMFVHMVRLLGLPDPTMDAHPEEGPAGQAPGADMSTTAAVGEVERLARLFENGLITEDEYRKLKNNVING